MSFVATLALEEAYDTFADAQIAVQKAANAEGFCVKSLRSKVGSSKRNTVWLGCSHGGKYREEGHGVRRTSTHRLGCPWCIIIREGGEERCWKIEIKCTEHNHERTDNIAAVASMRKLSDPQQQQVEVLSNSGAATPCFVCFTPQWKMLGTA